MKRNRKACGKDKNGRGGVVRRLATFRKLARTGGSGHYDNCLRSRAPARIHAFVLLVSSVLLRLLLFSSQDAPSHVQGALRGLRRGQRGCFNGRNWKKITILPALALSFETRIDEEEESAFSAIVLHLAVPVFNQHLPI